MNGPNRTWVAPVKLVPKMLMVVPPDTFALFHENEEMVGFGTTWYLNQLLGAEGEVPRGVTTVMATSAASERAGAMTSMWRSSMSVNDVAGIEPGIPKVVGD